MNDSPWSNWKPCCLRLDALPPAQSCARLAGAAQGQRRHICCRQTRLVLSFPYHRRAGPSSRHCEARRRMLARSGRRPQWQPATWQVAKVVAPAIIPAFATSGVPDTTRWLVIDPALPRRLLLICCWLIIMSIYLVIVMIMLHAVHMQDTNVGGQGCSCVQHYKGRPAQLHVCQRCCMTVSKAASVKEHTAVRGHCFTKTGGMPTNQERLPLVVQHTSPSCRAQTWWHSSTR